jgi:hypothetical protein
MMDSDGRQGIVLIAGVLPLNVVCITQLVDLNTDIAL